MKKLIVLTLIVATAAISCKKAAPIETITTKQTYTIRVYNPENNAYSPTAFIKL